MILTKKQAMQIAKQGGNAVRITDILRKMEFHVMNCSDSNKPSSVDIEVINTDGTVTRIEKNACADPFSVSVFKQGDFRNRSAGSILKQMVESF